MRTTVGSIVVVLLAVPGALLIGLTSTTTADPALAAAAATALIVGGTGDSDPASELNYLPNARDYYIAPFNPSCTAAGGCNLVGIMYPAQLWPIPWDNYGGLTGKKFDVSVADGVTNLNIELQNLLASPDPPDSIVIFGYSQGARVATVEKIALAAASPDVQDSVSFVLIGNPNRPNGGILTRFGFLGHVPIIDVTFGQPTPTDTSMPTTDIAYEYDGVADFPEYPIDLLADINAFAGYWYVHPTMLNPLDGDPTGPYEYTPDQLEAAILDPANRQTYGDTTYITIPTLNLPILQPLRDFATATNTTALITPLIDLIQPTLKVLIDLGYNRSINPGVPTEAGLIPPIDPVTLTAQLITSVQQGVRAALTDLGMQPVTPLAPPSPPNSSTLAPAETPAIVASATRSGDISTPTGAIKASGPPSGSAGATATVATTSEPPGTLARSPVANATHLHHGHRIEPVARRR
jgi:PE-PPE domain